MFPFLLLLFFLVPLIEIYLLIEIGGVIGVGWTIFFVVFTAVLGAFLVRAQGFSTINRIRTQMNQGQLPAIELIEGLFLLIADAVGFVCLTPPLRRAIIKYILSKGIIQRPKRHASSRTQEPRSTIEGEFRRMDD